MKTYSPHIRSSYQKGFTLVEILVSMSIFAIVSVVVADLFVIASKAQRRARSSQILQTEVQSTMSNLVDRVRIGTIDYDAYGGVITSNPQDKMAFIDEQGNNVIVKKASGAECPDADSSPCLALSMNGAAFSPVSPSGTKVNSLQIYLDPVESPLAQDAGSFKFNVQPRVTIVLGLESVAADSGEPVFIQTTVSTRKLLR